MRPPLCRQQEQQDPGSAPNAGPACDPRVEEMQRLTRVDVLAGLLRGVQPGRRDKDRKVAHGLLVLSRVLHDKCTHKWMRRFAQGLLNAGLPATLAHIYIRMCDLKSRDLRYPSPDDMLLAASLRAYEAIMMCLLPISNNITCLLEGGAPPPLHLRCGTPRPSAAAAERASPVGQGGGMRAARQGASPPFFYHEEMLGAWAALAIQPGYKPTMDEIEKITSLLDVAAISASEPAAIAARKRLLTRRDGFFRRCAAVLSKMTQKGWAQGPREAAGCSGNSGGSAGRSGAGGSGSARGAAAAAAAPAAVAGFLPDVFLAESGVFWSNTEVERGAMAPATGEAAYEATVWVDPCQAGEHPAARSVEERLEFGMGRLVADMSAALCKLLMNGTLLYKPQDSQGYRISKEYVRAFAAARAAAVAAGQADSPEVYRAAFPEDWCSDCDTVVDCNREQAVSVLLTSGVLKNLAEIVAGVARVVQRMTQVYEQTQRHSEAGSCGGKGGPASAAGQRPKNRAPGADPACLSCSATQKEDKGLMRKMLADCHDRLQDCLSYICEAVGCYIASGSDAMDGAVAFAGVMHAAAAAGLVAAMEHASKAMLAAVPKEHSPLTSNWHRDTSAAVQRLAPFFQFSQEICDLLHRVPVNLVHVRHPVVSKPPDDGSVKTCASFDMEVQASHRPVAEEPYDGSGAGGTPPDVITSVALLRPVTPAAVAALQQLQDLVERLCCSLAARMFEPELQLSHESPVAAERCNNCNRSTCAGVKLSACSACKAVKYCSRTCQAADWKAHKKACKEAQMAQGKAQEKGSAEVAG